MRLIVLSENFGLNFSGGCIATAKFLETLQYAFDEVVVLAQQVGQHHLSKVQFVTYRHVNEIAALLARYKSSNSIGYGDFYIAEHFIKATIPFYFSYHDNFPEIAEFQLFSEIFIIERLACYKQIFMHATGVFTVSEAKISYIQKYNSRLILVRNGVFQEINKQEVLVPAKEETVKILMAGNVDERKYRKAIELFTLLNEASITNFQIDIYGLLNNKRIAEKLTTFPFVNLMGYAASIPFKNYHIYLNTSLAENLSIAVVDAIANYTPVITFDVGGLKEVINLNNGFLISPFNIVEMKGALLNLNFKHFAQHFDQSTIQHFDWKQSAAKMLNIMQCKTLNK